MKGVLILRELPYFLAPLMLSTKTRHKRSVDSDDITGVSTTMVFGHVALQVLTIRVPSFVTARTEVTANVRAAPWSDLTLRIWPTQPTSLVWPPRTGLNGEAGINLFADRFSTSDLEGDTWHARRLTIDLKRIFGPAHFAHWPRPFSLTLGPEVQRGEHDEQRTGGT